MHPEDGAQRVRDCVPRVGGATSRRSAKQLSRLKPHRRNGKPRCSVRSGSSCRWKQQSIADAFFQWRVNTRVCREESARVQLVVSRMLNRRAFSAFNAMA